MKTIYYVVILVVLAVVGLEIYSHISTNGRIDSMIKEAYVRDSIKRDIRELNKRIDSKDSAQKIVYKRIDSLASTLKDVKGITNRNTKKYDNQVKIINTLSDSSAYQFWSK